MEALLPLLIKIVQYGPQIKAAIETGTSVLQAVNKAAPEVMPLLERAGKEVFPALSGRDAQYAAGGMIFHYERTRAMQADLNKLGVAKPALEEDGIYGPSTKAAVTKFQEQHPPLEVDGWADRKPRSGLLMQLRHSDIADVWR
jgi:Putative peptidoglycan binding domain